MRRPRRSRLRWDQQQQVLDATLTRLIAAGALPDPGLPIAELRRHNPDQLVRWRDRTIARPQWFAQHHTVLRLAFFQTLKEIAP